MTIQIQSYDKQNNNFQINAVGELIKKFRSKDEIGEILEIEIKGTSDIIRLIISVEYKGINESLIFRRKLQIISGNGKILKEIKGHKKYILSIIEEKKQKCEIVYTDADLLGMYDFGCLNDIEEELETLEDILLVKNKKIQINGLIKPFEKIKTYIANIGCFENVSLVFSILIIHLEQNENFSTQQKEYIFNLLTYFIIDFRNNLHILLTDFLGVYNPNYSTNIEALQETHYKGENIVDLLIQKNSKLMEGFIFQMINDLDNIINPPEEYPEGEIEFF